MQSRRVHWFFWTKTIVGPFGQCLSNRYQQQNAVPKFLLIFAALLVEARISLEPTKVILGGRATIYQVPLKNGPRALQ
jgi:hypothetical protein